MTKLILLMVALSSVAKADFIKKTEMNLLCEDGFQLISDGKSSSIYLNQELIYQGNSSSAGTEGGDPYQQFVGGGYNITIQGDEFSLAFSKENGVYRAVNVTVSVNDYDNNKYFSVDCSGKVKFSNAF
jgi:hypothetical protein